MGEFVMSSLVVAMLVAAGGAMVEAEGVGRPPAGKTGAQATLMARRAAEVVAVRNLGLKEAGVDTNIRTGRIRWSGVVRGYQVVSESSRPDGSAVVVVRKSTESTKTVTPPRQPPP